MLVLLSIATSIDAFAIGPFLAMLQVQLLLPVFVIGVVTGGLSLSGPLVGHRLDHAFGKHREIVGGLMLILIGFRVLILHMI